MFKWLSESFVLFVSFQINGIGVDVTELSFAQRDGAAGLLELNKVWKALGVAGEKSLLELMSFFLLLCMFSLPVLYFSLRNIDSFRCAHFCLALPQQFCHCPLI